MRTPYILMAALSVVLLLGGCTATPTPASPIRIGSKDFTEELLLGEMYAQLLEANGVPVVRSLNLPGTQAAHDALVGGQIDLYPEYTGTGYLVILGIQEIEKDPEKVAQRVEAEYKNRWGLVWLDRAPMNDTNAIACTPETVRKYGIKTLSDLSQKASQVRMAAIPDFPTRADGLAGLKQLYKGFEFKEMTVYQPDQKYGAITSGKADCVVAFSTEGQIAAYHLVVLEDDRGLWPVYQVAPVVRGEVLQRSPRIRDILSRLAPFLTNDTMAALNWEVDGRKREVPAVAKRFLEEKGLLE